MFSLQLNLLHEGIPIWSVIFFFFGNWDSINKKISSYIFDYLDPKRFVCPLGLYQVLGLVPYS